MTSQPQIATNNEVIKEFYRKTKLIQKNQVKTIWQATHIYTGDVVIAKIQSLNQSANQRTVLHQGKFLQSCQGSPGIPFLVWCGKDQVHKQGVLIQQKLGKTLKHLIADSSTNTLSLKSVLMIGIQLMKVIACYHQKGYIHRNINLDTIQFGVGSRCDKVYFNDFIQSRSFYKKGTLQHIDKKSNIKLKKASEFTSQDALDGIQPGRKDDIESIMLVLMYLLKGKLPWSDVWTTLDTNTNNKNSIKKGIYYSQKKEYVQLKSEQKINIMKKKQSTTSENKQKQNQNQNKTNNNSYRTNNNSLTKNSTSLNYNNNQYELPQKEQDIKLLSQLLNESILKPCKLQKRIQITKQIIQLYPAHKLCSSLPKQFQEIYSQVKNLEFNSKPNYMSYIQKLNAVLIKHDLPNDNIYDWMNHKSLSQSVTKGGLSVKEYQWLITGPENKSKLVELENQPQILAIYQKLAPFIEIDKLISL